jgi:hypothetical protein
MFSFKIQTYDCPGEKHLWKSSTVGEVAEEVGISIGSCHTILMEDLGMCRVSAKFVPRLLTDDLQNLLQRANDD